MSALGNVIAAKIMALNQEEKAAVLSFCVGYGCDDALTKSAEAALMCLKGGILMPAEHAEKCTCCADYKAKPKKSTTFTIRNIESRKYLGYRGKMLSHVSLENAIRWATLEDAACFSQNELTNWREWEIMEDGGAK